MAKPQDAPITLEPSPVADAAPPVTYRDKLYTSRTLILPQDGRPLPVFKARVVAPAADTEALAYLAGNKEFELLKE